jgi:hypothetical protein
LRDQLNTTTLKYDSLSTTEFNTEFLQFSSLGTSIFRLQVQMSAWLEIPRHRSDGRHRLPNRQLCDRLSKILQKFFLELSCIQTVLPYRPDSRTLAACNFHIKAWRVRTMTSVIQTVNLMHSISYMKLARPDHEDGRSDVCFFNARLALWISTSGRESTSSKLFQLSSHIWGLERNPITDRALSGARTCN